MSGKKTEKKLSHPKRGKRACRASIDDWFVIDRHCTYKSGQFKHSESSLCKCRACGTAWRTKADYVVLIADGSPKERLAAIKD